MKLWAPPIVIPAFAEMTALEFGGGRVPYDWRLTVRFIKTLRSVGRGAAIVIGSRRQGCAAGQGVRWGIAPRPPMSLKVQS
jgi:hypothetical protein